jgi:UDP-glucose 4-epimerase
MLLKGEKVLVTGHKGFIGQELVRTLEKYDNEVTILEEDQGRRIDIRDWNKIKDLDDFQTIYHLAALTFVPYSFEYPKKTYDVNVGGTLNMLELGRLVDAEQIVTMSSYVYGTPQYLPIDENHPTNPNNPYTHSKLITEELCEAYSRDFGLNCVVFRPFNIYGPGQNENFLIPSIINQLKTGKIELKDPEPKRDFIYLSDVVNALLKVCKLKNSETNIFNIGSGESYSVKEITDKIVELTGKSVKISYTGERRKNEIMNTIADVKRIKKILGWEPLVDINQGLSEILDKTD